MGKPTGFLEQPREEPPYRPVEERVNDWRDVYADVPVETVRKQASRCMDCGIPFCNQGCPLGNLIPEWNDLIYRDLWREALDALLKTNNFPEFTGTICPAPCESACVLAINDDPVTIKMSEWNIIKRAWDEGWMVPNPPTRRTGKRVAVIGSGPAGLAAADQLNKAGHYVTVFERSQRPGGLLTFGIPDFKLEKPVVERRLKLMEDEGVIFRCGVGVGVDVAMVEIERNFDAVVLALGSTKPRDLPIPGRELVGIHYAMDFLTAQNEVIYGDLPEGKPHIDVRDKHVVIIGGGDTASDCLGTANRQGARSVTVLDYNLKPGESRPVMNPWPEWPMTYSESSSFKEGGQRKFAVLTKEFLGDGEGHLRAMRLCEVDWEFGPDGRKTRMFEREDSSFEIPADHVFLAIGYLHPEKRGPISEWGLEIDRRGNVKTDATYRTSREGVFAAGDCRRGQSLVVWAIAEGRKAARACDLHLMGESDLRG
ncbi:MAG: glutamate synthase subunit beta [Sumerlaeia bacterium]